MRKIFLASAVCFLIIAESGLCHADERGQWPMDRHDLRLTGRQSLPGAMSETPAILARYKTPQSHATLLPVDLDGDEETDLVLSLHDGALEGFDPQGKHLWNPPPDGPRYLAGPGSDQSG